MKNMQKTCMYTEIISVKIDIHHKYKQFMLYCVLNNRKSDKQTFIQLSRRTNICTNIKTDRNMNIKTDIHTSRQTYKHQDRHTNTMTDIQTPGHTFREQRWK